jgi:hypothetical protein
MIFAFFHFLFVLKGGYNLELTESGFRHSCRAARRIVRQGSGARTASNVSASTPRSAVRCSDLRRAPLYLARLVAGRSAHAASALAT